MARAVARQVELTLTPQEASRLASTRRVDPAAHELYLRGRFFWNKRGDSLFKAIDYLQEAIDIDPEYAAAYAGLADSYLMLAFYVPSPPRELMPKAEAAAMKALELDDSLAEPHVVLGFVRLYYDWDWVGAEREFQRSVELSPNDATVRMRRAFYLAVQRRPDEALVEMQAARDLDPLSPTIQRSLGTLYYWTRRYELAIQEFRDALELDPGIPQARAMLARALARQGKLEEATREIDLVGNSLLDRTERALIQALTGQRASALQALEEIKRDPAVRYLVPTVVAETYGALGDLDQAFEWMEVAFQEKDPSLLVMAANQNPTPLRSDPRFQDLLRRIGIPEN